MKDDAALGTDRGGHEWADRAESRYVMEITLADLLVREPRLLENEVGRGARITRSNLDQTSISWAVTARTTLPHLPPLRGGELLLLPARAIAAVGNDWHALIRESATRAVSGVVMARGGSAPMAVPMSDDVLQLCWDGALTADTETDINRLLTECRSDLYRIGTDLERRMADLAAGESGLEPLARVVRETTGLGMVVIDALGRHLIEAPGDTRAVDHAGDAAGELGDPKRDLMRGAVLVLVPERSEQRMAARFLSDRIVAAANQALQRDEAARPRGPRRVEATARLLAGGGSASDRRSWALALGFDPDALFYVAVSDVDSTAAVDRALASIGAAYPAGGSNGHRVTLVVATPRVPSETLTGRIRDVTGRWERDGGTDRHSLALSGPAFGVASLPRAAREAEFVAAMQSIGDIPRRAASFGSTGDLGVMGLLYQLRDSPELREFIVEALGALPARDQRGTLRATLRAFLESGGSQVDASRHLGIHRNTLSYRLRRIGELIGRDVADPTSWLTLHLALRASNVLDVFPDNR